MKQRMLTIIILSILVITTISGALHFAAITFGYPGTNVYVNPASIDKYTNNTHIGDTFTVTLNYGNMTNLAGIQYTLYWNNALLNVTSVHDSLPWSGSPFVASNTTIENYNATFGQMNFVAISLGSPASGSSTFRTATFQILAAPPVGSGNFLNSAIAFGPYGTETIFGGSGATVINATIYNGEFSLTNPGPVAAFNYSPLHPLVNTLVNFNATASYIVGGGATITSYSWTFGDSTTGTGVTTSHTYTAVGNYSVTLNITDSLARSSSLTHIVTVTPAHTPPIANFTFAPHTLSGGVKVNVSIAFNASASHATNGTIASYGWSFGDGNKTTVSTPIINHTYTGLGNFTVVLNVTDSSGSSTIISRAITVWPQLLLPVASFTHNPAIPAPGVPATFNASASFDADGVIVAYNWNFGDGNRTNSTSPVTSHTFAAVGSYIVNLTVIEDEGFAAWTTQNVTVVVPVPPTANFTYSPSMVSANYTTTFDASASSGNGFNIASYIWNFGDGNITTVTASVIFHSFSAVGNFTVALTVISANGLNDTISQVVNVLPEIPWLDIQPSAKLVLSEEFSVNVNITHLGKEWQLIGLQFNLSYDPTTLQFVNATVGTFWSAFPWMTSPPYTFTTATNYESIGVVTVYVVLLAGGSEPPGYVYPNGNGIVASVRFKTSSSVNMHSVYVEPFTISGVEFGNQGGAEVGQYVPQYSPVGATYSLRIDPPVPQFTYAPINQQVGQTITFNASASYVTSPFGGSITSYVWNFGDGSVGTGQIATHVYTQPGSFTVTLTVTDSNNNSRSNSTTLTFSPWHLDVYVDTGTIYFRSELSQFYILTEVSGSPVSVDQINATLYLGSQALTLSSLIRSIGPGLYWINYTIPVNTAVGTWDLVVTAQLSSVVGVGQSTFQISSTLTQWNAQLMSIEGNISTIRTDIGQIQLNLTSLNAHVTSIDGTVATIQTDVGNITANIASIGAQLTTINGTMATVQTNLGTVTTSLNSINAKLVSINGTMATVQTDLGTMQTSLKSINGTLVTIKSKLPTDTGTIATLLYVAIIFAVISAVVAILVYLGFRKKSS